jgi:apolipoprotein D and lipocalin family protein
MSETPRRSLNPNRLIVPGLLAVGAGSLIATCWQSRPVGNARVPEPAKPVEFARYLGRWYEIGRYDTRFERDCEAVTADYALRPDGLISVVNTCRNGSPTGRARSIECKAKIVEGSGNTKLKVSFFGPFYVGNYWVLDHADDYGWSIVGEPSGKYLWLLARDATPQAELKGMLFERAQALGYDTSMIRMTWHEPLSHPAV